MQFLKDGPLYKFRPDTMEEVRKLYGLDLPGRMDEGIDILDSWVKQQEHFLKRDFPREYLERIIIMNKGSLERSKKRLDKICTLRTLMSNYFCNFDLREQFKEFEGIICQGMLPRLTSDHHRVHILRVTGDKFQSTIIFQYFKIFSMYLEYMAANDYASGYHIILDYRNVNIMELASNFSILDTRQGMTLTTDGVGVRIKGMHILSPSKMVDNIVRIFKQVLSAKVGSRLSVHKDMESLHVLVEKHVLPVEYGGSERPLEEIHEQWLDVLTAEEYRNYWKDIIAAGTDESLRPKDEFNQEYMGMPGTFRTLNVD